MKDYPVIKFAVPFAGGIIFDHFTQIGPILYMILLPVFSFLYFVFRSFQLKSLPGLTILLYLAIFFFGSFIAKINTPAQAFLSPNVYIAKNLTAYGEIERIDLLHQGYDMPKDNREKTLTFQLQADSFSAGNFHLKKEINLIFSVQDESGESLDSLYNSLKPGNYISITGNFYKGRETRNPGEFNYDKYLRSKGISGIFTAYNAHDVFKIKYKIRPFEDFLFSIRKSIDEKILRLHSPMTASLLKGLLLNDRSEMDYKIKTEFINSGVIHVLAVSGLHVGYIILVFLIVLGRFNIYVRSILTAAGLILFMFLTGAPASVVRATLMALIILTAFVSNRSTNLFNSLALSAVIILLIKPGDLFDPGFQLSYTAVFSMAAIYPIFNRMIAKLHLGSFTQNILLFMTLSLSAQIGTLPFTLFYFGRLSLTALAANLFVIPAIGIVVGISIFTLVLSIFSTFAASIYAAANDVITFITLKFIELTGNPDFSFLWIRNFSIIDSLVFYLLLILFFYWTERFKGWKPKIILTALVVVNMIFIPSLGNKELLKENELNVMMIDVGQGDAFLLKFPNGETALIDAGEKTFGFDNGERVVLPLLNSLAVSRINYAFISHLDSDHCGGLKSLITNGMIGKVFKPKSDSLDPAETSFEAFLKKYNIPFSYFKREGIHIGNAMLYILNEPENSNYIPASTNERSGIIKIVYGKTSFLFTGDAERKTENFLLTQNGSFLKSDVLKISHHGSNTSSTKDFIESVKPRLALISSGIGNKFNHPSPKVIERLNEYGVKILRTDKNAAVILRSDGKNIYEVNWKNFNE